MLYHNNGILGKLSVIGLGCWNFGAQWNKVTESEAIRIIRYAIDNGVNFVDVAESYGFPDGQCEMILGKALKGGYREKVKIISKIGWYGRRTMDYFSQNKSLQKRIFNFLFNRIFKYKDFDVKKRSPELLRLCGHACCGRLKTDYIDVLLCHDSNPVDIPNFIDAFDVLQKEGFIKHYGISTESLDVLRNFYEASGGKCEVVECDYSLLNRVVEGEFLEFCHEKGISVLTRGTLSRGLLSGKYNLGSEFNESSRVNWNKGGSLRTEFEECIKAVNDIKSSLPKGVDLVTAAYRYVFSSSYHPSVIVGVTSIEQMRQNIQVASAYMEYGLRERLAKLNTNLNCGW